MASSRQAVDTTIRDRQKIDTFSLNGRTFVSGLHWETLDSNGSLMKEARSKGRKYGMDVVAIRKGVDDRSNGKSARHQAGFAPKERGAVKGMYSLATVLASYYGDNWIGAFRIDEERYALAAVVAGSIVPSADRIGTLEEIRAELGENFSHFAGANVNFSKVIAPPEFEYADECADLASILVAANINSSHRLQALTFGLTTSELVKAGVGTAVIIAVAATAWSYKDRQDELARLAAQAKARADAKAREVLDRPPPPPPPPPPWSTTAPLPAVVTACANAFDHFPLVLGGWTFETARCTPDGSVEVAYSRGDFATAKIFEEAAQAFGVPANFYKNGDKGVLQVRVPMPEESNEPLKTLAEISPALFSHFQRVDVEFQLQAPEVAAAPAAPADATAPPPPNWQVLNFASPMNIPAATFVLGMPSDGLRATEVGLALDPETAQLTWTITGTLYVR